MGPRRVTRRGVPNRRTRACELVFAQVFVEIVSLGTGRRRRVKLQPAATHTGKRRAVAPIVAMAEVRK